jgi:hypothetical protein
MASASNVASDDYYKVLGVDRQCDEAALKKAYRRAAVKWHPDKWSSKSQAEQKAAEENFKRVAEAYDALSDPQKRAAYDRYGKDGSRSVDQGGSGAPHVDPEELFRQFFGGAMGGPGMAFGGMPMGGMHFGGGPGMAFYVNGVPVGGRRRGGAPQPPEMPQIEVPPFVEALIKTVPPPLLVVGVLAFVMLAMQLVSALMQFLMPVMFPLLMVNNFAPQHLRAPLMLGLVATSLATAFL